MEVLGLLSLVGFFHLLLQRGFWLFSGTMVAIGFGIGGIIMLFGGMAGLALCSSAIARLP